MEAHKTSLFSRCSLSLRQAWAACRLGVWRAKKLIVFLVPADDFCNGGLMSIAALAAESRRLNPDAVVVSCLYPWKTPRYPVNPTFPNEEHLIPFRWLVRWSKPVKVIVHIPEYLAGKLCHCLSSRHWEWLRTIPDLHLNILNQNIDLMEPQEKWRQIFDLTAHVTQTTAHARYATQEVCDRFGIPLHHFSTHSDHSLWPVRPFQEKEKIIAISKDANEYREPVLRMIRDKLPDYSVVEVRDMSFMKYLDLISRARFTLTFGEGFDGYFSQPIACGSIGIAVYNDRFFPSSDWLSCANVYASYPELIERFAEDVRKFERNEEYYNTVVRTHRRLLKELYSYDGFMDNLIRFYRGNYDFYPKCATSN